MKNILLTGATSMIGVAIIKAALKCEYSITCIVRKNSSRLNRLCGFENVKTVECDLKDYKNLNLEAVYDGFIHLAWDKTSVAGRDNVETQLDNIKYTLEAVKLAKRSGCKVFIGAGSQAEYGIQTAPLTPSTPVKPESGYGIAKFSAGKFSQLLCNQLNIRFNWLRILSAYGYGDGENTLISYVINTLKKGESPELTPCTQIWDYIFCDDVAEAFLCVLKNGKDGKSYPLGSGNGRELTRYVEDIRDLTDKNIPLKFGAKPFYPHQPMYLVADISELSADTGWLPKTSFKDGIQKILNAQKS